MPADRIRNWLVAPSSGKTSLNEALLYEAGAINPSARWADGHGVDSRPTELGRCRSPRASRRRVGDRKVNLINPRGAVLVADRMAAYSL